MGKFIKLRASPLLPLRGEGNQQMDKWVNGKWVNGKCLNGKWVNGKWVNGKWVNGK